MPPLPYHAPSWGLPLDKLKQAYNYTSTEYSLVTYPFLAFVSLDVAHRLLRVLEGVEGKGLEPLQSML